MSSTFNEEKLFQKNKNFLEPTRCTPSALFQNEIGASSVESAAKKKFSKKTKNELSTPT